MAMYTFETQLAVPSGIRHVRTEPSRVDFAEGRYRVKLAETAREIESALRLRYEVFRVELLGEAAGDPSRLEFDEFDFKCRHLIVIDQATSDTVGTYRLNSLDTTGGIGGFYSYGEFTIENLPAEVLRDGVEIGRACIASEHRNTKVLFLLWKGLASYLRSEDKRFFFGCCSIFTRDESAGAGALHQLIEAGHFHESFRVAPRRNGLSDIRPGEHRVELPSLFSMYLRIGARVCGPPMIDHDFGTIDFFVVCDTEAIEGKYRRMFFSE